MGETKLPAAGMKILAPNWHWDVVNPYIRLLYGEMVRQGVCVEVFSPARILRGSPGDVWHVHWPEQVFRTDSYLRAVVRSLLYLGRVGLARARGVKLVWTLHNVMSHDRRYPRLERWFRRALIARLDGWISLSEAVKGLAEREYPRLRRVPSAVIPHGHFRGVYPSDASAADARSELGIPSSAQVVLNFGSMNEYKNVVHLIRTFARLPGDELRLLVVGECRSDSLAREIREEASRDPRVLLHLEFVAAEQTQFYFNAADLAVLPFRAISNSSTAVLAMSFALPLLVPNQGSMPELTRYAGAAFLRTYDGELDAEVLRDGLAWARTAPAHDRPTLEELEWSHIVESTVAFYRGVLGESGAPARRAASLGPGLRV